MKDRRKLIKKMDVLFSKIVRSVGQCEWCGRKDGVLQCAHIIGRANKHVRFDLENAVCLCYRCHIHKAHKEPVAFIDWINQRFGDDLIPSLKERANSLEPVDYECIYEKLKVLSESI